MRRGRRRTPVGRWSALGALIGHSDGTRARRGPCTPERRADYRLTRATDARRAETAQVSRPIDEIDRMDDLSSQDKSYSLGYYLFDLVGKGFSPPSSKTRTAARVPAARRRARVTAARPRIAPCRRRRQHLAVVRAT